MLAAAANPMLIDGERFCREFLPAAVPERMEDLDVPLLSVATDLHARKGVVFASGELRPRVAASMAIPGLIRPVVIDGRVLVDGAAVDPLPFGHLRGKADIVIAVDCSGGSDEARSTVPGPWEGLFATIQVMSHAIVAEKLARAPPDILVVPRVGAYRLLDFFMASAILRAAEHVRAEVKEKLEVLLAV
jgi:NTE family protein